jgi:hypothetical protein
VLELYKQLHVGPLCDQRCPRVVHSNHASTGLSTIKSEPPRAQQPRGG